ncbi:hypothetical protein PR202_gb17019 [Eleusine coracana subsp. coracana]|uniref:Pentatricopeptide repeat-containing protein n=1 Tax=Eleusine coracana subsp. coracana TaxID=191504 RepID=A0AAV5F1B5_ELECO|nr:hypothetical protein PR202_gb17019 [Eleusine coracana subsp. coracana]
MVKICGGRRKKVNPSFEAEESREQARRKNDEALQNDGVELRHLLYLPPPTPKTLTADNLHRLVRVERTRIAPSSSSTPPPAPPSQVHLLAILSPAPRSRNHEPTSLQLPASPPPVAARELAFLALASWGESAQPSRPAAQPAGQPGAPARTPDAPARARARRRTRSGSALPKRRNRSHQPPAAATSDAGAGRPPPRRLQPPPALRLRRATRPPDGSTRLQLRASAQSLCSLSPSASSNARYRLNYQTVDSGVEWAADACPCPMHDHLAALLRGGGGAHPQAVHGAAVRLGCIASTFLCNKLLLAYLRRPVLVDARRLFDEMPRRNLASWYILISSSARLGALSEAFVLFSGILHGAGRGSCDRPDSFTLGALAAGCARAKNIVAGAQVHACAVKFGVDEDESVAGALVDTYAKCGRVDSAWRAFALAPQRSVVSWTSMIACLVNQACPGYQDSAITLFKKMLALKVWPTNVTFSCILKVFDVPELLPVGMQVHGCLLKMGTEVDPALGSALMTMYGRCGGVEGMTRLACRIKHDVFCRTSLLVAYARNGYNTEAIGVFREMIMENVAFDQSAITSLLQVCSSLGQLRMVKEVHCYALRTFFRSDTLLLNAAITAYSRCGDITSAENVFNLLENKDIISWTALLTCYGQNGLAQEVLMFFKEIAPQRLGIDADTSVENALVNMYAKCGSVQHGDEETAVQLFHLMQEEGVCPDDYTFVGLLSSCSRMGLVQEGCEYFKQMTAKYNLVPKMEHYTCMVDLYGRAGKFSDAVDFIGAMPYQPDQMVWQSLLASCKVHGNVQLGRLAAKKILEITPEDPSPYIVLSSIHASVDMWDEKAWNRNIFDAQRARKDIGSSWINAQKISENIYGVLQVGVIWVLGDVQNVEMHAHLPKQGCTNASKPSDRTCAERYESIFLWLPNERA